MGCNFCTTSAFFGGKGKFINFYETGDELFDVMCRWSRARRQLVLHDGRELPAASAARACELLERMKEARQELGAGRCSRPPMRFANTPCTNSWNWECPGSGWGWSRRRSTYAKLQGTDTRQLTRELRGTASCAGLDHRRARAPHARQHRGRIEHAVAHDTDFHQFMLYTPVPGTPLYSRSRTKAGSGGPGSRRHSWPVQIQFPARGHFARRLEALSGLGILA